LVGGLFTIVNTGKRIYFIFTPAIFYLVLAFLAIYCISLPLAWPRRKRRLLRWHVCIADYASLFYASYLLHDPESKLDISAPNVTQRHLTSRVFLEEKLYSVGIYNGVDGKCHFGLDVVGVGVPHVMFWPYEKTYWNKRRREERSEKRAEEQIKRKEVRQRSNQGPTSMV
jgi:hypothetical protein